MQSFYFITSNIQYVQQKCLILVYTCMFTDIKLIQSVKKKLFYLKK